MTHAPKVPFVLAAALACILVAAPAYAKTCEEEMPEIKALIEGLHSGADKTTAEHQYEKAQQRLADGKERSCLLYLESARAAIEAEQMSDH